MITGTTTCLVENYLHAGQVEQVLHEHAAVLEAIAAVHPGHAGVDVDTNELPG